MPIQALTQPTRVRQSGLTLRGMDGRWEVNKVEDVYTHDRVKVSVAEVELPDKTIIQHHAVSVPLHPKGAAVLLANVVDKGILMIWRHRFITDDWTWELPGGGIDAKETPAKAAEREFQEETGWKPGKIEKLVSYQPANGLIDLETHCFITHEAAWVGPGRDKNEASDIAWMPLAEMKKAITKGDLSDGASLTALTYAMAFDKLR